MKKNRITSKAGRWIFAGAAAFFLMQSAWTEGFLPADEVFASGGTQQESAASEETGQPDKAVGHFSNVMAIDSSIAEVRFYLSDAYGALGNMDSSMKYLNLYMKKVP